MPIKIFRAYYQGQRRFLSANKRGVFRRFGGDFLGRLLQKLALVFKAQSFIAQFFALGLDNVKSLWANTIRNSSKANEHINKTLDENLIKIGIDFFLNMVYNRFMI